MREALDCLDFLDSHLEYEEWVMEQVEAAQDVQDDQDDDDDDDDDVYIESEDEGYNSDGEEAGGFDIDDWIFGLAPMLRNIHL